jgi:hypothetical protein
MYDIMFLLQARRMLAILIDQRTCQITFENVMKEGIANVVNYKEDSAITRCGFFLRDA